MVAKYDANQSPHIFTIGHSNHSIEVFLALLKQHHISAIADVRTVPYSKYLPHFNKAELRPALKDVGISYVFLGDQLGGRPADRSCYVNGQADYQLVMETENFRDGIKRVLEGARQYRICLMCSEKDPLDCHRTILVSRHLMKLGTTVSHILAAGKIESAEDAEARLLKVTNQETGDLFETHDTSKTQLDRAYELRGETIAYAETQEPETVSSS